MSALRTIGAADQIASLMLEISDHADDPAIRDLIAACYPFARSIDELAADVLVWRDAMRNRAGVGVDPSIQIEVTCDGDVDVVSAIDLIRDNAENLEFCGEIRALEIGEACDVGGGASPYFINRRIR